MTPTPRLTELAQLAQAMRSGNYNGQTLARFRELVAAETRQRLAADPAFERRIRQAVQTANYRAAARRDAVEAGRRAGMAAARRMNTRR